MNHQQRIKDPNMTTIDIIVELADGNPGAATIMADMVKRNQFGILEVLLLDTLGIYGSNIWVGYKDICESDINRFVEELKVDGKGLKNKIEEWIINGF